MTKKEQAQFDSIKEELGLIRALRWTELVKPDVPPPSNSDTLGKLSVGWICHTWGNDYRVKQGCSSSIHHSRGRIDKTDSQGTRSLYSSKLKALKAVRYESELLAAQKLLKIDREIEKELAQPTS